MPVHYIPARLVEGNYRWYIVFYQVNPVSGLRLRFRETYDLNRIPSVHERRLKAFHIIREINEKLPQGYPFEQYYRELPGQMNIIEAIDLAVEIKVNNTDRLKTATTMESAGRIFKEFLGEKEMAELAIGYFQKKEALKFLDFLVSVREIKARTYNNYIEVMRSLFNELLSREYIRINPFSGLKKKKETGKERRAFSEQEMKAVLEAVSKRDRWLLLAIFLQYHCFIRPVELRRLRFSMIDLSEGVIRLPGSITKNRQNSIVTIPDVLMPFLLAFRLDKFNLRWHVFGAGMKPHPDKSCGYNTMNNRHRKHLQILEKAGILKDITGLTFYSWKDTGAMELFKKKVNPLEIMKQLRHEDLNTTQRYCQSLYMVNQEIKTLDNKITDSGYLRLIHSMPDIS